MKEEVEILSRELELQCDAVEHHIAKIKHLLKQIQIQLFSKKPVPVEPVEPRCRCEG